MRFWLAVASLALWSVSAQQGSLANNETDFWRAALGWLQPGIAALDGAAGGVPEDGFLLPPHGVTVYVAK